MVKSIQLRNTEVLKLSAIIFWVNFLIKSFVLENFWVRKKMFESKKKVWLQKYFWVQV